MLDPERSRPDVDQASALEHVRQLSAEIAIESTFARRRRKPHLQLGLHARIDRIVRQAKSVEVAADDASAAACDPLELRDRVMSIGNPLEQVLRPDEIKRSTGKGDAQDISDDELDILELLSLGSPPCGLKARRRADARALGLRDHRPR
jgi:hypothetical protein